MSNRIFISTNHFKTMLKQWSDQTPRMALYEFHPQNSADTIVLVSELRKNGFLLYWANKENIMPDGVQKMADELATGPLPF